MITYIGFENKSWLEEFRNSIEKHKKILNETAFYLCKTSAGMIRFRYSIDGRIEFDCILEEK